MLSVLRASSWQLLPPSTTKLARTFNNTGTRLGERRRGRSSQLAAMASKPDWEDYNSKWEKDWSEGLPPGQKWDKGSASGALTSLIGSGTLVPTEKRVLVPGCGRGYDVVEFASAGAACAVGLDISETGVQVATDHWQAEELDPAVRAKFTFLQGDFFTFEDAGGAFDVGYDYTFLCALHPTMRENWAQSWARLLRPGGELVTLMYPVDPAREGVEGPPWAVTPDLYTELLKGTGSFDNISLEPVPTEQSHPDRVGKEFLGRWRRL